MGLFVVLQRNRDSPGLYFHGLFKDFESLQFFPWSEAFFFHFRMQKNQYFCIRITFLISESPEIHCSPHTVPAQQSINDVHDLC